MKVIGITGGVGAGKSSVLGFISSNYNCEIIYADSLAASLQKKGGSCYQPLIDLLGDRIIASDGEIDRKLMASIVFSDESLLGKVNDIVHPKVKDYIVDRIAKLREENTVDYFFIEAALLIECGYREIVDEMWYIYASEDVRRERLKKSRGYSDEKIDSIFKSQLSDDFFRQSSDVVIDNSMDEESTNKQIRANLHEF